MGKPFVIRQTPSGKIYKEYTEGLPDSCLNDFWKQGKRRLESDEQDQLSADEWIKYYFWLQAEVLRELKRK